MDSHEAPQLEAEALTKEITALELEVSTIYEELAAARGKRRRRWGFVE